jgi:formate-dependent nitrite reductase membrane component NrfD
MKHREEGWGWMLAADFFFAGMGGGMLLIGGLVEMFIGEGRTSVVANFLGPVFIGVGAGLLILELGRPLQAWRVFMNPKAILTIGAWVMSLAIAAGFAYAFFGLSGFAGSGWAWVRKTLAFICAISGLVVATYPGILLGRHKARPFWNGPGMMSLFFISSLVTGVAAHSLSGFAVFAPLPDVLKVFPWLTAGLLGMQLLFWCGYIWVKRSGATVSEAAAARKWIDGDSSGAFQTGFLLLGTVLPMALVLLPAEFYQEIGATLVLLGGITMRLMVVRSGEDRTWLPGEQKYRSRLPLGNEAFLKAWEQ